MPAASTVKVLISAALWCAVEEGELDAGRRLEVRETPAPGGGGLLESLDAATALTLADLDVLMLARLATLGGRFARRRWALVGAHA